METDNKKTIDSYKSIVREYNEMKEKAEGFASKISSILYDVSIVSIQGIETVDDDHIRIFGTIFWGGSDEYIHFTIPLEWFVLSKEELVPAIDRWIHEYREAKKRREEEERKKKEEVWRKQELAELARLQEKYGKEAQ